jgi:hypothetical protein
MTTTSIDIQRSAGRPSPQAIAAVTLALLIGAALGSVITSAVTRDAAVVPVVGATWDAAKLDAFEGRLAFVATRAPTLPWDDAKMDALAGRVAAAETETPEAPATWDPQKLDALSGRLQAG